MELKAGRTNGEDFPAHEASPTPSPQDATSEPLISVLRPKDPTHDEAHDDLNRRVEDEDARPPLLNPFPPPLLTVTVGNDVNFRHFGLLLYFAPSRRLVCLIRAYKRGVARPPMT